MRDLGAEQSSTHGPPDNAKRGYKVTSMDEVKASLTRMLKAAKREIRQLGLRRRIFMGTNPERIPTRPAEPEQLDAETRRILADRMRTFEHDRKASGPADEVMERLLRRHPAP